ncbi:putative vacuolar protein sorting protein Vps66 [Aulographum hederae CBS 113979]|uniref:Putative vacuolar protein sorting protein Vps66 n=1 Tax=Aulographum hederae CBS 113979 TaxID=1176131 RepID=A0A6G1HDB5_9PEZI|nr:putative vacuolar protein sorting protein Vps66 [Aulographum hederae CBS 113979]
MEKYSKYRDKGSGIAPFLPVPTDPSGIYLPFHTFLFAVRIPLLLTVSLTYFLLISWLPVGSLVKKAGLWTLLGIPGIWWVDLQIDGVRRGSLASQQSRLPFPGSIIASSFTSPIDCLYLAAIFDPIFTASYPNTRSVQRISLGHAMLRALFPPQSKPPPNAKLVDLATLIRDNPDSSIVVLPECTTTNGRGILPFSPSLLSAPQGTTIFPISLRYTPADITTPVPGAYLSFLWSLCSKPTHCIRVRIAESVPMASNERRPQTPKPKSSYETNFFDDFDGGMANGGSDSDSDGLTSGERKVLNKIGEALARLGRVKRVGLSVKDKDEFVALWRRRQKIA